MYGYQSKYGLREAMMIILVVTRVAFLKVKQHIYKMNNSG